MSEAAKRRSAAKRREGALTKHARRPRLSLLRVE